MSEDGMHITRTPAGESPSGVSRSLVVLRPCDICREPCDDREAWADRG